MPIYGSGNEGVMYLDMNYFSKNILGEWDKKVLMSTVVDLAGNPLPDVRQLTSPIPCGDGEVPKGFISDGASCGVMRYAGIFAFPKHKHPIAFFRHDWRCSLAANAKERRFADNEFRLDVARTGTWWESIKGYIGVRLGAILGIGVRY